MSSFDIYPPTMIEEGKKHKKSKFSRCPFEKNGIYPLERDKMMILLCMRHFLKRIIKGLFILLKKNFEILKFHEGIQ